MNIFLLVTSAVVGYFLSHLGSDPRSSLKKKLPVLSLKFIQVSPNIKISIKGRTIHVHHWMYYSVILIVTLTYNVSLFESLFAKGYMAGAIIQGLTYPDWKKFVLKK